MTGSVAAGLFWRKTHGASGGSRWKPGLLQFGLHREYSLSIEERDPQPPPTPPISSPPASASNTHAVIPTHDAPRVCLQPAIGC